jgi:hypothetical protein
LAPTGIGPNKCRKGEGNATGKKLGVSISTVRHWLNVAAAFDRMAVVARRDGISLVVNSGFRSDAEQAKPFAQNPNPTMVAPPGKSLHRCATEPTAVTHALLDLERALLGSS